MKFTAFHDIYFLNYVQKQTKEIKEKQTSVMAELAKVEPAVQDAKMGKPPIPSIVVKILISLFTPFSI